MYSSLLVTGPFSIVLGYTGGLMALNDRLKLRSMVVADKDDKVFIASEEAAIRVMEPDAGNVYAPTGGEPVCNFGECKGRCLLRMSISYIYPEFEVVRNPNRCIACRVCERQCANEVHSYDADSGLMLSDESKCVDCQRCVSLCPTRALKIVKATASCARTRTGRITR